MLENQKELAAKAVHATIGAPVVVTRNVREYGVKLAGYGDKLTESAKGQLDEFAAEGEKLTKKLQGNNVVEEIQHRVDLEKVQDRVEKLRDQLEAAMQSWRESFTPGDDKSAAKKVTVEAVDEKPAARKAPAKASAKKTTPAKKTTAAKRAPAKKAPAATS